MDFLQTHIFNLPIGLNSSEGARDAVTVKGVKWKIHLKPRWKSGVGVMSNEILDFFIVAINLIF